MTEETKTYDSAQDTVLHINRVSDLLAEVTANILHRRVVHDETKLWPEEKSVFDEWTPKLKELTYGSPEYKAALDAMAPALAHHYSHNSHHPEHWEHGIRDMSLLDLIEMLADWKAAGERHTDGDLLRSIMLNAERFGYGEEMTGWLVNTARELEWI